MNIVETMQGAVRVLRLEGRLDALTSPAVEARIEALLGGGDIRLAVDCGGLEYVSSAGLRVFLATAKRVKVVQGYLALGALRPSVQEIFEIAGFASVLVLRPSVEEAVAACAG